MSRRLSFYKKIILKKIPNKKSTILVCGGDSTDMKVFQESGYSNVTITNLDTREDPKNLKPYKYKYEDAQSLSFNKNTFDYVVIHAAIHHCQMPHKVLLEMYRVARLAVIAFESRDSVLMQFLIKIKVAQEYEHAAVFYSECKYGGVNNTDIPNYIFRWTENEVEKTIKSFAPEFKHQFSYDYSSAFPSTPKLELNNSLKIIILFLMRPFYFVFSKVFYKQQNQFAFFVEKPSKKNLFPWLKQHEKTNNISFNINWAKSKYKE